MESLEGKIGSWCPIFVCFRKTCKKKKLEAVIVPLSTQNVYSQNIAHYPIAPWDTNRVAYKLLHHIDISAFCLNVGYSITRRALNEIEQKKTLNPKQIQRVVFTCVFCARLVELSNQKKQLHDK